MCVRVLLPLLLVNVAASYGSRLPEPDNMFCYTTAGGERPPMTPSSAIYSTSPALQVPQPQEVAYDWANAETRAEQERTARSGLAGWAWSLQSLL